MLQRALILSFAVASLLGLAGTTTAIEPTAEQADCFLFDGKQNILEESHFGIVNGKLTVGIPYRNVFSIRGLWAPPYASSNFDLDITLMGQRVATERYTWRPFQVDRSGTIQGIAVETVTMLLSGSRAGLIEVTLKNTTAETRIVPVTMAAGGTLDWVGWWEFATPASKTATTRKVADGSLRLEQGSQAIVLRADGIRWEPAQARGQGSISLPPSGSAAWYVVFAVGPEAEATCKNIADRPREALAAARAAYADRVRDVFQKLPRFESSNQDIERLYYRSLVHFVTNRWDVPEFVLHPYYSTGSINGGCLCEYLWNFGECWEIFPLYDPEAHKSHVKAFLAADMMKHFAIEPLSGKAWGPWYMVNQEKIIGMIYYHTKNTGDAAFLADKVDGRTVLEHAIANAMYGDDPAKPVGLIDYGKSNSHLELLRGFPYNHVMPDLNGRRYQNYVRAAELAEWAGKPAPILRRRAEELKGVLKQTLWNKNTRWFDFLDEKGSKNVRYTVQMFKLFNSKVLDAEEEEGLLGHLLSEREFLSEFGLHSMSKTDPAYDPNDVDNGGSGACTCFPPLIAERLYRAGRSAAAENILKRILWWGQRMPYWGDSIRADRIDYRRDTPLQCTIDGVTVAQCIIFGMFGVEAELNGDIRINPHPPAFSPRMKLKGLRLRGHVLDISVEGGEYEVREGERKIRAAVGRPVVVRSDGQMSATPK